LLDMVDEAEQYEIVRLSSWNILSLRTTGQTLLKPMI
jgi:hypothetical protein